MTFDTHTRSPGEFIDCILFFTKTMISLELFLKEVTDL